MNCANHAEVQNVAFCIRCGRALCKECVHQVRASVYCDSCLGDIVEGKGSTISNGSAKAGKVVAGTSPGAAFALGLIPGVGAIYNGEFLKAAAHILIFGVLVTINEGLNGSPADALFGMLAFGFYVYMPFEAYYTARKIKLQAEGIELETPVDRLHQQLGGLPNKELWGGVALVAIGGLFLLDNFGVFRFDWVGRLWPVILIGVGIWLLRRFRERSAS